MRIFVARETYPGERRVPMTPGVAEKLVKLGLEIEVETSLGQSIGYTDDEYTGIGATISTDRKVSLATADMVLRLRKPPADELSSTKKGCIHVSYLDPFQEDALEVLTGLSKAGVSAVSMEMIPRTTIAQKMDALSSQANLGGYVAVILAAERLQKIFPMMMTPSGTINPSKVFIVGVGVAGLQAIATAKRLGARVEAFDTRPVVEEQVQSLGAKFVKIDLGETGQTKDGYAKALTDEQIKKQREGMKKHCAQADVLITTAQVFGRKAPVIITQDMVEAMRPGSIIVDMATETGGNVEGSRVDEEVMVNGVRIIGLGNLPGHVAVHASQMYATNLASFVEHFWDKENKTFNLDQENEIIAGCLVTHGGKICNQRIREALGLKEEE